MIQTVLLILIGFQFGFDPIVKAAAHRLSVSDVMPEFSVKDIQGEKFHYNSADKTAILIVFYSPEKRQSIKAIEDIRQVLHSFESFSQPLTVVAVSDDPNSVLPLNLDDTEKVTVRSVKNDDFKLWGELGVIASPTVFIADIDAKIVLVKAGYGYDFAPSVKLTLQVLMGLTSQKDANEAGRVKTVTHVSKDQKANRHLKMAEMLEKKGRYESAIEQLKIAAQIDPNDIISILQLGRLYCVVSDPNKAIESIENLDPENQADRSFRAFVLGMAYSQLKDFEKAEKYLLKAVELDSKNSKAFYELGKIYQDLNQQEKAAKSYRKSLDIVFYNQP